LSESAHTGAARDEALRTLYRLREEWNRRNDPQAAGLKAIERLIEEYERELTSEES
jgi:hypothetical protein